MSPKSLENSEIKVYNPKSRVELRKEQALPLFSYLSSKLLHVGGFTSFFSSMSLGTIKGFFFAKQKIRDAQMKKEKVLDLRKAPKKQIYI